MSKQISPEDRLIGSWEPSLVSPIGPDGSPAPIPVAPPLPPPPVSICQRGPCRNYHRLVMSGDAAEPLHAAALAIGREPRQTLHTCYPAPGIEVDLELGDRAVYECSRWSPPSAAVTLVRSIVDRLRGRAPRNAPAPQKEPSE